MQVQIEENLLVMKPKDYYKVLGIGKTASQDEVKKAYREKSHVYHPDKTDGNEEKTKCFIEVGEAYSVLGDSGKRRKYDDKVRQPTRLRNESNDITRVYNNEPVNDIFEKIIFGNIEELFSDFYHLMFGMENNNRQEKSNSGNNFNYRHYDDLLR